MAHRRTFVRSVNPCAGMAVVLLAVSCIWCTDEARAEDVKQFATHPTPSRRLSNGIVHVSHKVRGLHRLEGHRGSVLALAVAPRADLAVSAGEDADQISWDLRTGRQVRRIFLQKRRAPKCLAITPDGGRVLVGMDDGSLRQYDPHSGRNLGSLRAHQTPVRRVAISDDGKWGASTAEDSIIRIWDLETRAERASIPQHVPITDLRFVGNEEIHFSLKLGNQRHILCVRNVHEQKNEFAVGIPGDRLSNALFLPEQRHVLAGVPDGCVKIWQ